MRQVLKAFCFHHETKTNPFPQGVLTRQYKFPNEYADEDILFGIYTEGWSDEEYMKFWYLTELKWKRRQLSEKQLQQFLPGLEINLLDHQLPKLSEKEFFQLGKCIAADVSLEQYGQAITITGWRALRYTDRSTASPYFHFEFYFTSEPENRKLYSDYGAENTTFWHKNMLWR
jgi:hypothetical protein